MEYSIKEKQIEAVLTSVNLDSSIDGGRVDVVIGDAAKMDVAEALNYIKSGQSEVQQVVDAGTATFNANASAKTEAFNNNATAKINAFNSNATSKTTAFNDNASSKTADFNTNAGAKTTAFNENASSKTSEYNSNATEKVSAYNTNATEKTTAFNTNYAEKKALIDEQVGIATTQAGIATAKANLAKQYAIGEPTEPTEHSAKYWAEQAESELSGLSSRVTTIEGNYVTTDTAQDISAKKTFLGEKAILFKQTATTDKLGFTLYNTSGSELGALEYRPNTISGGALINLNTSQSGTSWLGFRYWSNINIIAPKPSNGNYYIPVNFTDGTNTVTASSNGTVNLSSILPNSAVWGNITGTLSNQTDLNNALAGKYDASNPAGYTSNVGTVTSVNNTQPDANGNVTISTGGNYTAGTGIDITNDVISVTSPTLTNTATGSGNLVVGGSQPISTGNTSFGFYSSTSLEGTSFGYGATASGHGGVAIGWGSNATENYSTALGINSNSNANFAIQIGRGTNSTDYSLSVGFDSAGNYQLLDGTTGLIPDARISSNIARTSDVPAAQVNSDWNAVSGVAQILNKPTIPTVDQTYDGTSTNAQSGVAVAQALAGISIPTPVYDSVNERITW